MALILASYDIEEEHRDEYQDLWDYFDSLGAVPVLYSEYAVPFSGTAYQLAIKIKPYLRAGDGLLVCELFDGGDTVAWMNLRISDADFQEWLTKFARKLK